MGSDCTTFPGAYRRTRWALHWVQCPYSFCPLGEDLLPGVFQIVPAVFVFILQDRFLCHVVSSGLMSAEGVSTSSPFGTSPYYAKKGLVLEDC